MGRRNLKTFSTQTLGHVEEHERAGRYREVRTMEGTQVWRIAGNGEGKVDKAQIFSSLVGTLRWRRKRLILATCLQCNRPFVRAFIFFSLVMIFPFLKYVLIAGKS